MNQLDIAAVHESGHCYVAWRNGCWLRKTTVNNDRFEGGRDTRYWCVVSILEKPESIKNIPLHVIAGPAAQLLAGHDLREIDFGEVAESLERTAGYGDAELLSLVSLAQNIECKADHLSRLERGELFFESLLPRMMELFSGPGWICITALAQVLQEVGTVDGRTAAALFETIHGGLPDGVLPADSHTQAEPDEIPLADALDQISKYLTWAEDALQKVWPENRLEDEIHERARKIFLGAAFQFSDLRRRYLGELAAASR